MIMLWTDPVKVMRNWLTTVRNSSMRNNSQLNFPSFSCCMSLLFTFLTESQLCTFGAVWFICFIWFFVVSLCWTTDIHSLHRILFFSNFLCSIDWLVWCIIDFFTIFIVSFPWHAYHRSEDWGTAGKSTLYVMCSACNTEWTDWLVQWLTDWWTLHLHFRSGENFD